MKATPFQKRYSISIVLLWLLAWVYLLYPTSAPLALNGLPLDRKSELLVFIALTLTALFACVLRYLILIGYVPPPNRGRQQPRPRLRVYLEVVAIVILLTLLVFKLFFPESRQLTACFEIPGVNDHPCVWLPEGFRLRQPDQVSRYEESITFTAPNRPWRLATFNDAGVFGMVDSPEGTPARKIQELSPNRPYELRLQNLRKSHSHPFSASFRLAAPVVRLLREEYARDEKVSLVVKYTGAVDLSGAAEDPVVFPYSETEQTHLFDAPASSIANLVIRYRNFRCADETQTTSQCASSLEVTSLPLDSARLDVAVINPGDGRRISLGYAPLLAESRGRTIFLGWRLLEWLAGIIAALAFLLRLSPYFSSVTANAAQFAREARRHRKVILQILLVGALSAVATRAFYRLLFPVGLLANGAKLTILFPLGAAYVSLFWMVLFSKRARQFLNATMAALGPGAVIVALSPFLIYLCLTLCIRVPPMNEATFLTAGDDAIGYATNAMGILETGVPRMRKIAINHYLVKPLFLHSRALYYAIFGGGETHYSVLITTAYVCVWSLGLVFSLLGVSSGINVGAASSWRLRIAIAAGCAIAFVTVGKTFLANGATFAGQGFSEGPAWLFGLASFAFLITLTKSSRPVLTLWLIGLLFAGSIYYRSQYIMFLPLLFAFCAFLRRDVSWKRILVCLCLPPLAMGAFFLLFYLRNPPTSGRAFRVKPPFAGTVFWEVVLRQAKLLFPGYWEILSAISVFALLVWEWISHGATKRLIFLLCTYAATVFILDGLVAGNYGYHPRHIVMAFFLSSCASIAMIQNRFVTHKAINESPV
jgi:hypothetical protein